MNNCDERGSHLIPLIAAVQATSRDVLELGSGFFSTPILINLLLKTKRHFVSIEQDPQWWEKFNGYNSAEVHVLHAVDVIKKLKVIKGFKWSVAFIDHEMTETLELSKYEERKSAARYLADKAEVLVVHDTEHGYFAGDTQWQEWTECFKYRWIYRVVTPETTVLSDTINVESFIKEI